MPTVCITGGNGLIGKALTPILCEKGYSVIILSRLPPKRGDPIPKEGLMSARPYFASWNIEKQTVDKQAIEKSDFIIHLAGENVAGGRWTEKRKREIQDSRVNGSRLIVSALKEIPNGVKGVVSASAIGWYGADPKIPNPEPFVESAPADNGYLGRTCLAWEESIGDVTRLGKRLAILRTGIVLSNDGGALTAFRKPIRFGIAPILGSGKQVISWIHVDDLCRLYLEALENENYQGPYNAVAPAPVDNKTLVMGLAKKMKGRFFIPFFIPSFLLKIGLGEMSIEVLKSTTVSADRIRQTGFQFLYPSLDAAFLALSPETVGKPS
jgi:uncharacterized protein